MHMHGKMHVQTISVGVVFLPCGCDAQSTAVGPHAVGAHPSRCPRSPHHALGHATETTARGGRTAVALLRASTAAGCCEGKRPAALTAGLPGFATWRGRGEPGARPPGRSTGKPGEAHEGRATALHRQRVLRAPVARRTPERVAHPRPAGPVALLAWTPAWSPTTRGCG